MDRLQKSYLAAQRAYEAMEPPGHEDSDFEPDCNGEECGMCKQCADNEAEYAAELAAENEYDRRKEEGRR